LKKKFLDLSESFEFFNIFWAKGSIFIEFWIAL
jgi:hypothetical protein